MGFKRIVFPLFFLIILSISTLQAEVLKTINVSMPTNYGTFLGEIHYSEKDLAIALKVERIIKEDLIKVINYFEYVPYDVVHFNLDPYLRLTNGNARTFPTNIINLYNFPANNLEHLIVMENWLQGLVLHEFVHITHLDQTRDYLKLGRQIFGTIAKVPTGIVPRWFTEGIAVWGESHLISGGRLNNHLLSKELLIQFKNPEFCKTIDCLDTPGIYPHGQLAYWAGAHFLEFLENQKPKTIKCLVEMNSASIPFFLNDAFESCAGGKAQDLFKKFREQYIQNSTIPLSDFKNAFGSDDFQKGMVLDGDHLYKVEQDRHNEVLMAYDLKDGVSFEGHFDAPIADVAGILTENENKFLLVSFNDDSSFRIENKSWKLIDPETMLVERTLSFPHDPSYVIPLTEGNFLTFSYWKNHWQVESNGEVLRVLPSNYNINFVKKIGDQLLLKINDSYGVSSLILSDFKLQKLVVLYQSDKFYEFSESELKALILSKNQVELPEYKLLPDPTNSFASEKAEAYPRLDHLIPHYWFLAFGNSENVSSIGATTTLVDPMEIHSLAVTGLVYSEIKKVGGSLDYKQKMIAVSDLWTIGALVDRDYSKTDFNSALSTTSEFKFVTNYQFLFKKWMYVPGFVAGSSTIEDFISTRTVKHLGITNYLIYQAQTYDDFFQTFFTEANLLIDQANAGNAYLESQLKATSSMRLETDLLATIRGTYTKLFKSDFDRGVVSGGGVTGYSKVRNHEFYGVPYGSAFGNQVFTARLALDYNFWNIYRGKNLLPFFFKEAHFILGHESLYADRIFLEGKFLRKRMINSIFAGPRLKMNIFYYVPTNIDLIFSSITNPNGKSVNQANFSFTADLF